MTLGVIAGTWRDLDAFALGAVQSVHVYWLDVGASAFTIFGQPEVTAGVAAGLAVARLRRYPRSAIAPLLIAVTVVVEAVLKVVVAQPAPPQELSRTIHFLPFQFVQVTFANTFPSGHVARLAFLLRVSSGVPTWLVAGALALMILTRLYLADHWLSDTIGGLALGLGTATVARRIA